MGLGLVGKDGELIIDMDNLDKMVVLSLFFSSPTLFLTFQNMCA